MICLVPLRRRPLHHEVWALGRPALGCHGAVDTRKVACLAAGGWRVVQEAAGRHVGCGAFDARRLPQWWPRERALLLLLGSHWRPRCADRHLALHVPRPPNTMPRAANGPHRACVPAALLLQAWPGRRAARRANKSRPGAPAASRSWPHGRATAGRPEPAIHGPGAATGAAARCAEAPGWWLRWATPAAAAKSCNPQSQCECVPDVLVC